MNTKTVKTKLLSGVKMGRSKLLFWQVNALWISVVLFMAATFTPMWLNPPGLATPEPIGKFLNGNLPASRPSFGGNVSWNVVPAFPNLTFNDPLAIVSHPNQNRLFVASRQGVIHHFVNDPDASTKTLFGDISERVAVTWDAGFLGMAFHPDFGLPDSPNRNYVYVFYTAVGLNGETGPNEYVTITCETNAKYYGTFTRLSRFEVNEDTGMLDLDSELKMINMRAYNESHRGGGMVFGDDGFLYLAIGDQNRTTTAQRIASNIEGGVIRIDVDMDATRSHAPRRKLGIDAGVGDESSGNGYFIPNDNPWMDENGSIFEEYYTVGNRQPHRMTKDKLTGDMWIGEVGHGTREEINVVKKAGNYGWPHYEGFLKGTSNACQARTIVNMDYGTYTPPVIDFSRRVARAIIGGYVYRGNKFPDLYGKYICGDYSQKTVFALSYDPAVSDTASQEILTSFIPGELATFGQDQNGELYMAGLGQGVTLYTLEGKSDSPQAPQLLSQTGAFKDLINLVPSEGVIPYAMIEPFWSDDAEKFRWLSIPNDGSHDTPEEQIKFSENGNWEFPVGSVMIKHFELGGKRLETRFEVKGEDGRYYYLTYKWNEQDTDAFLLSRSLDETLLVDGKTQVWHYPNTAECLACHQQSIGSVLGLKTRYQNNEMTYPRTGTSANQLVTLSHLGIFDQTITEEDTEAFLSLVSKDDPFASLDDKARSYLDINCSYCHQPAAGNRAGFDARFTTPLQDQKLIEGAVLDDLEIDGAKIVVPGDIEKSIIYHRVNAATNNIAMPPLAKNLVDAKGVQLLNDWILSMSDNGDIIVLEAECATVGEDWTRMRTSDASNGEYISSPGTRSFVEPPLKDSALVTFDFTIETPGTYKAFARTLALSDNNDSFWVRIDNGPWLSWNRINFPYTVQGFTWNQIGNWTTGDAANPLEFSLGQGEHTLTFSWREARVGLDKVIITQGEAPLGLGDQASNCTPLLLKPVDNQVSIAGDEVSLQLSGSGGSGAYMYAAEGLPEGLSINPSTGLIRGKISLGAAKTTPYDVKLIVVDPEAQKSEMQLLNILWTVNAPEFANPIWLEAECAEVGANWATESSEDASAGRYVIHRFGDSYTEPPLGEDNLVRFAFTIDKEGTYRIFARTLTNADADDSFWVRVDGGDWLRWNRINFPYTNTGFTWNQLGNWKSGENVDLMDFDFLAGNHTLEFSWRETNAGLDKVLITNGPAPQGFGGPQVIFEENAVYSFSKSQDNGVYEVLEAGNTLRISENGWKAVALPYEITPNTVVEFEFKSENEGEEHGIGFDQDLNFNNNVRFKLYGTQNTVGDAFQEFYNYPGTGEYEKYIIPVGAFLSGEIKFVYFFADDDAFPFTGDSYFRNVKVYEQMHSNCTTPPAQARPALITADAPTATALQGVTVFPNPVVPGQPQPLKVRLQGAGKVTLSLYNAQGQKVLDAAQMDEHREEVLLDTKGLRPGTYLLKINGEGWSKIEKVIVY